MRCRRLSITSAKVYNSIRFNKYIILFIIIFTFKNIIIEYFRFNIFNL